jgi:hypothetical protein
VLPTYAFTQKYRPHIPGGDPAQRAARLRAAQLLRTE